MRWAEETAVICCLVAMSCSTDSRGDGVHRQVSREEPPVAPSSPPTPAPSHERSAAEHDLTTGARHLEASPMRALGWSPDGESIVAVGTELSVWSGDPLHQTSRVGLDAPSDELSVGGDGVLVPCAPRGLCVRRLDDLGVARRLRCEARAGELGRPEWARWAPGGRWVAAHCIWHPQDALEGSETLSTCVWDGRSGRRVRCVAGTQPDYHRQPMEFSPSATLAVSVLEGFELLRPPRFRRVGLVQDGAGAMDHGVFVSWSRSGSELTVLSSLGCAIYRLGEAAPIATFEPVGRLIANASSPVADETAVLYDELVAVYASDGTRTGHANVRAAAGGLRWSHDGQLLAVAWQRDEAAGFLVYRWPRLRLVYAAEHAGSGAGVPVAWHPTEPLLAFASGSSVEVREFGPDAETQ